MGGLKCKFSEDMKEGILKDYVLNSEYYKEKRKMAEKSLVISVIKIGEKGISIL
jgi:hypothetical protein